MAARQPARMTSLNALELNPDKVTVNGGAIALGPSSGRPARLCL